MGQRNAGSRGVRLMQTAIIVTLPNGDEVLVTIQGIHVLSDGTNIQAATRNDSWSTWGIPLNVEVRHEG